MRRGFTLVEMLVATALVMLMMVLFAEVFGAAIGTMTAQKGIANNDQKARSFTTILRHDLAGRTYRASQTRGATRELVPGIIESPRGIVPLAPGDVPDAEQLGYLYVSENDVDDDTDDVFQFTAEVVPTAAEGAQAPYYGRARFLEEPDLSADPNQYNPNQPERDDGIERNDAATSRAAEIAYFVRGGNLYRRVMLIRDPLPSSPSFSTQPTTGPDGTGGPFTFPSSSPGPAGPPYFDQPYTSITTTSFYNDWDFSGTRVYANDTNGNSTIDPEGAGGDEYRFHFHGLASLDNAQGTANTPLGIPWNRFGFYSRFSTSRPVEYLFNPAASGPVYIGRFTHEETSHSQFDWPGIEQGPSANIMTRPDLVLSPLGVVSVDANTSGTYDAGDVSLQGGRAGEDILLTNVEAFDIEVWDPEFVEGDFDGSGAWDALDRDDDVNMNGVRDNGAWVDPGHRLGLGAALGEGIGVYCQTSSPAYGGNASWGRQTPAYGPGGPAGNHVYDTWHPEGGIDANGDGTVDPTELLRPPYRPLQVSPPSPYTYPTWPILPQVNIGDVVFPYYSASPGPENYSIGFVAVRSSTGGTSGASGATEPAWTPTPGATTPDNEITWQCFDNRIGLEQIRITVRYRDVSTQQARQVTLVHSLVD